MLIKCQVTQVSATALSSCSPAFLGGPLSYLLIPFGHKSMRIWLIRTVWFSFPPPAFLVRLLFLEWVVKDFLPAYESLYNPAGCRWPFQSLVLSCKIVSQEAIRVCWEITAWTRNVTICPELSKSPLSIFNWDLHLTVPGGQEERVGMALHACCWGEKRDEWNPVTLVLNHQHDHSGRCKLDFFRELYKRVNFSLVCTILRLELLANFI